MTDALPLIETVGMTLATLTTTEPEAACVPSSSVAVAVIVRVAFPSFGPSVFLAAELTAEAAAPSVDLLVKRAK